MLKFWKNSARGKSKFFTRPPDSPTELPSSSKSDYHLSSLKNDIEDSKELDEFVCETSRLSKTLIETLSDEQSLSYFVKYMKSVSLYPLIDFWLEVEKFKLAASNHFLDRKCLNQLTKTSKGNICRTVSFESTLVDNSNKREHIQNGFENTDFHNINAKLNSWGDLKDELVNDEICKSKKPLETKIDLLDYAVSIFKRFIALESPFKLNIPDDERNTVISLICHPDGVVDPGIFKIAQEHIFEQMATQHFEKYLESVYHFKYQIDILTNKALTIEDIIYNETAVFYFMEYLEQEQCSVLLEFIMAVINFKKQLIISENYDSEQAQNDAIVLYDKYFSLQATNSLGFSSDIRFLIEGNICQDGGPSPDCFHRPFRIILKILRQYLSTFLTSQVYYKYLTEMISSVQNNWYHTKKLEKPASDCSSEISVSTRNTATGFSRINEETSSLRIDLKQLYNGDLLWRRKSDKGLCLGRVNSLGRFESSMEPDPEKKDPSIIKRVVNKFVYGDKDKTKEDLAWQVAHMIVKDVTDITMGIPEGQL